MIYNTTVPVSCVLVECKMHDIIMWSGVALALCSDGLDAWRNKKGQSHHLKLPWLVTGFPVVCWRVLSVWATLNVLILLALVRGLTSGGGIFAEELDKWQFILFKKIPTRALTRAWGHITRYSLKPWARTLVLGGYAKLFKVNLTEISRSSYRDYESLHDFFTRELREEMRPVCPEHSLVSPVDGVVVHAGKVEKGMVEQVKGVNYNLSEFLGPHTTESQEYSDHLASPTNNGLPRNDSVSNLLQRFPHITPSKGHSLFHAVVYLSPSDYHHFHSPTTWNVQLRRHIVGELLTVAPWVLKQVPNLFALSERIVLAGYWEHGFFSLTAVGAYNVGSIEIDREKHDLETNRPEDEDERGKVKVGEFSDKLYSIEGTPFRKGEHIGLFHLGSTVVLVFEAPSSFEFVVRERQRVKFGQPLGMAPPEAHTLIFGDE